EGQSSYILSTQNQYVTLHADGVSNWSITSAGPSTATVPSAPSFSVQLNSGGTVPVFAGDSHLTFNPTTQQFSTPSIYGYQPPGNYTTPMNRDVKLNADISPQNYNGIGEGTWESGTNDIDGLYQA